VKVPETVARLNVLPLNLPREMRALADEIQRVDDAQNNLLGQMARAINGFIEFGNVTDQDTNIRGTWVEQSFTAADTKTVVTHNMNIPISVAGAPNVRWLCFGFEHDGDTTDAASTLSVNFEAGDAVAVNTIELRLYVGGTRVVDGDHPVTATLFFTPAVS
jgi:hypothetical protein